MKKILLTVCAALAAGSLFAVEPTIINGNGIRVFSQNGKYALCDVGGGNAILIDLTTGEQKEFLCDEWTNDPFYTIGMGNCLANDGTVLSSTRNGENAAYYKNGEWHELSVINNETGFYNSANGITPDGKVICGSLANAAFSLDASGAMSVPAVWTLQNDGTYGEYTLLPHPDKDLFGNNFQYITAIAISDDGKTVVGQTVDGSGMMNEPIVYKQDENGEWSYELPIHNLYNPDGLVLPEDPGDGPMPPSIESFMTEEEKAAYNQAMADWQADGYDYSKYPNAQDYISAENYAKYEEAYAEYQKVFEEWDAASIAYSEVKYAIQSSSPNFVFNNVVISPDGKYYGSTAEAEDPNADPWSWMPVVTNTPWAIDLTTKEVTKYDEESREIDCFIDGGVIVSNGIYAEQPQSYIIKDGVTTSVYDYLSALSPEMAKWCQENFDHVVEMEVYNPDIEDFEVVPTELCITGLAFASYDMKHLSAYAQATWDNYDPIGWYFPLAELSGVSNVVADSAAALVKVQGDVVVVSDAVVALDVYNAAGALVLSRQNPAQATQLNLTEGVYIVKATAADGTAATVKIVR